MKTKPAPKFERGIPSTLTGIRYNLVNKKKLTKKQAQALRDKQIQLAWENVEEINTKLKKALELVDSLSKSPLPLQELQFPDYLLMPGYTYGWGIDVAWENTR